MKSFKAGFILMMALILPINMSYSQNVSEEETSSPEDYLGFSLEIPEKTQELIGLKTQEVEVSSVGEKIYVTGRIAQDVEEVKEVFASETGTVKKCMATLGSVVVKGQVLCLLENADSEEIEVKSPLNGVIVADFIKEGDSVDTISPIHTIADLTKLPASFDVYEKDVGKIKMGQKVLVYTTAFPEKPFEGKIVFVSPRIDETSFTVRIRVEINNPDLLLKPGMFVRGEIILEDNQAHLIVPVDSVQNLDGINVVFLQDEKESFTPTKVEIKFASNKQAFVNGELKEGDVVVTDGAFILKSKVMESEIAGGCAH